jgi:hypothetical protein
MKLRNIWRDPVWSQFLGGLLLAVVISIWKSRSGWSTGFLWLQVPVWSVLLILVTCFLSAIWLRSSFFRKTYAFEPKVELGETYVEEPDLNKVVKFPLKCFAIFHNESEGCVEVRVRSYEPGMIKLQQFVVNVLQLGHGKLGEPEDEGIDLIAVLPKRYFRAWIAVDATKCTPEMVRDQHGKRGILTLTVNGKPMPFQL